MEEIIRILNTLLRILQTIIVLGSAGVFIYLGILFYFKKYDEVKKNLPYVVLGLALLISVYSIPVIILSFLEKGASISSLPNNSLTTGLGTNGTRSGTGSGTSGGGEINCQIITLSGSFQILTNLSIVAHNNNCDLSLTFQTTRERAYVLCQYGNDNQNRIDCWGIYGSRYNTRDNSISADRIDFSGLDSVPLNQPTQRLSRFPPDRNTIYCTSLETINYTISLPVSDKRYLFVLFAVDPHRDYCSLGASTTVTVSGNTIWARPVYDIFGVIATTTR